MAETIVRGPDVSAGSLLDGTVQPFDGPSIGYQGDTIPDPRFTPMAKDGMAPGRVKTFFNSPYVVMCDNIPQKSATNIIAAAQVATALTALALVTAQVAGSGAGVPSLSPAIPLYPATGTALVTTVAIDFGFATGTTVAGSTVIAVQDNRIFALGQWILIGGAADVSSQTPLITQVTAIATANITSLTVANAAATAISHAPIGQANLYSQFLPPGTQFGPPTVNASAVSPYLLGGLAAIFDPAQNVSRNLTVTASTIGGGTATILISGYDVFGFPMTELLTASGTTTVAGKKAFKYISSAIPQTSGSATFAVGLGDLFGINLRSDKWEYLNIFYNGGFAASSTGWTAAVTSTANNTSGDVRGTVNGSTLATIGTTANGTARLTMMMSVPLTNMLNATPLNSQSLFGVTQA